MLSRLVAIFLPHEHNNHKAKVLHHRSLIILLGVLIMTQSAIALVNHLNPGILGYASLIPPQTIVELTNKERQKFGLSSLKLNAKLSQAAQAKAHDMFAKNYWAHNAPDGREPWGFILDSGYSYLHAGENLARDFNNPDSIVEAWMKSPTHKANLISSKYQDIGVAVVDGKLNGVETTLVVQMFGTVQSAVPLVETNDTFTVPKVLAQEVILSDQPKFSPFDVSRSISLAFVIMIVATLAFDWLIVWRRNIIRISGKNWAHLTFFATLAIILILIKRGLII
ncbi:hypothetical protein HYS10_00790 [Candidatus Collierbacteria bacterium]|nr:hypothetical protein [Candidatus Collierbacteria bacterium]